MKKITKANKILIQWIETMPDGNPVIQTRKYNNEIKADAFGETLPQRGIMSYTKKTTETITFSNKQEIAEGQISIYDLNK